MVSLFSSLANFFTPSPRTEPNCNRESNEEEPIIVTVEQTAFPLRLSTVLTVENLIHRMYCSPFKEKGKNSMSLHELDSNSFRYYHEYISTRKSTVFDRLNLESLIKVNACASRLLADVKTRQEIIASINAKIPGLKACYSEEGQMELCFQDFPQEKVFVFLDDLTVQEETRQLDLRSIKNIDTKLFEDLLKPFTNTMTLFLTYSPHIFQEGWRLLSEENKRVASLHLDFSNITSLSKESLSEIQKAGESRELLQAPGKSRGFRPRPLEIHIAKAGKLDTQSLEEIGKHLAGYIASLDLTGSKITASQLSELLKNCKHLKGLTLNHCTNLKDTSFLNDIGDHFPHIEELSFFQSAKLEEAPLIKLITKTPSLKKINVGWHAYLTDNFVATLADKCPKLAIVNFTHLKNITDNSLKRLAEKCSGLSEMHLDFCKSLTTESLITLSQESKKLQLLSIRHAFHPSTPLSSKDAHELMKRKANRFNLFINKELREIKCIEALALDYPHVTLTVN